MARELSGLAEDARVLESTRQHLFMAQEVSAKVERQGYVLDRLVSGRPGCLGRAGSGRAICGVLEPVKPVHQAACTWAAFPSERISSGCGLKYPRRYP